MSKYIIELDDRIKLVTSVGVTENGVVYTTSDYVHNLEELNSDYINEHFGSLQDDAYQKGFEDGKAQSEDGCEGCQYVSRTSEDNPCVDCSKNFDNHWTAKQTDEIKVGDEVIDKDGDKTIVTHIHGVLFDGLCHDGSTMSDLFLEDVDRTGRHFKILEEIKE